MDNDEIRIIAAEVVREERKDRKSADALTWVELVLLILAAVAMGIVPGMAAPLTLLPSVGLRSYQCLRDRLIR